MKVSIKALRVNSGLSQVEAAEKIGVTGRTLQNWEKYKTFPMADQLLKICTVYGCELSDIFLPDMLAKSE